MVLSNQERFKNSAGLLAEVNHYSRIDWIQVNSKTRQEHIYEIQFTELNSLMGKSEIVSVKERGSRPYERKDRIHHSVAITLDLDKKVIVR